MRVIESLLQGTVMHKLPECNNGSTNMRVGRTIDNIIPYYILSMAGLGKTRVQQVEGRTLVQIITPESTF